jgi:hypothetical protein
VAQGKCLHEYRHDSTHGICNVLGKCNHGGVCVCVCQHPNHHIPTMAARWIMWCDSQVHPDCLSWFDGTTHHKHGNTAMCAHTCVLPLGLLCTRGCPIPSTWAEHRVPFVTTYKGLCQQCELGWCTLDW